MRPPRRAPEDPDTDTLRMPRPYDAQGAAPRVAPQGPPHAPQEGGFAGARRPDSYLAWLALGLVSPFLLAVPLYPLVWFPVTAAVLPVAAALWSVLSVVLGLFGSAPTDGPPAPTFWDFGSAVSPQVALTSAAAVLAAWFVLRALVGKRRWWHEEGSAKRGVRAGLRLALLVTLLLAIWWLNRTLAGQ
jgi:hypothetical protein